MACESENKDDLVSYKRMRNNLNNRLKTEEKLWQSYKLSQCKGDSKSTWKSVKEILNWSSLGPPSKLFHKGQMKIKSQEIADSQNECFIEKIQKIKDELPIPTGDPLENVRNILKDKNCFMKFTAVHPDDVSKIISELTNSTAFGTDNIDTYIVKLLKEELNPAITYIINLSIESGEFPESWKVGKVIPIHKKDDILNPTN